VPVERVRLFYQEDQTNFPFRYRRNDAGIPMRFGEPQFYNTAVARRAARRWQLRNGRDTQASRRSRGSSGG
jgi:hypothetical protein